MDNKNIIHFNTKLKATDRNKLTRENYCVPSNKVNYENKKNIKKAEEFFVKNNRYPLLISKCYYTIPNDIFADKEHYTEQWVDKHYKACMENFDLNMNFFNSLEEAPFQKYLSAFCKKNKFKEIFDLKEVSKKSGIYILVLDKYKQVYIGKADDDVKNRILQHWREKKEFDRLLYGRVETSVLSIDSFGALDTTRIFYKSVRSRNIDELESEMVAAFNGDYLLNRVSGGLNAETDATMRNLQLKANIKKRNLNK